MKKQTWKKIREFAVIATLVTLLVCTTFELANVVMAQTTGYRFTTNGIVFQGLGAGICGESSFAIGPDACVVRLAAGQMTANLGAPNSGWSTSPNPPVIALGTATSGGTIPDGTSYRLALTEMNLNGGETAITATQEATQTTTGGGLSTITATAPIVAAGMVGYRVWSTNASGVGNSNATLTELSQPITTAVCAGAFQVNGPLGPGTGPFVCPFGTNAVFTSLLFTAATTFTPNIPGSGPTVVNGGLPIPTVNTAFYLPGIPQTICSMAPQTTLVTITTIQTLGSCNLSAQLQNANGKILHVTGHGIYTSGAQTGTMTISLIIAGVTPIAITSAAIVTGGQTNAQFDFDYYVTTSLTGTAGKVEPHGMLYVNLATAANGNILSVFADQNTAASSAYDLTAANILKLAITMTSSTTSATLRDAQVVLMN